MPPEIYQVLKMQALVGNMGQLPWLFKLFLTMATWHLAEHEVPLAVKQFLGGVSVVPNFAATDPFGEMIFRAAELALMLHRGISAVHRWALYTTLPI